MGVLYADRSERGKLRFSGEQDRWFLHQIMTQAFEDIAPGEARETAMLTAHGRMVGYLETLYTGEAILAHFEASLAPEFPEAIRRYVFATRVEIEDLAESHALILLAGDDWERVAEAAAPEAPKQVTRALGSPAAYLWIASAHKKEVLEALRGAGAEPATEEQLEALRVANGAPRWGKEMDAKTFPQEAGIDAWAVHFEKGCYVGQEAMAKIHFRGKVNRRLARLEGADLSEGATVELEGNTVGTVTSSAEGVALAIVKYTVEPGTLVDVAGSPAKVTN